MSGHSGIPLPPIAALAAGATQLLTPRTRRARPVRCFAAAALVAGSGALLASTVGAFRRRHTTLDPTAPQEASTLVTTGANRATRNPMYLGIVGLLSAHAVARGSWSAWMPVAAFALTIDRIQIPREEEALRGRFGTEFEEYVARTPRWLNLGSVAHR